MTSKLKTKALVVGTVVLAIAAPSHANLMATSKLVVNNFLISNANGTPLDFSDFSSLAYSGSANMSGVLSGTGGFGFSTSNGSDIDFPSSCLSTTGDCNPLPENGFPHFTGEQTSDFIAADQTQVGAPISNLPGSQSAAGGNIGQQATGSLSTTTAGGSANVNNGIDLSYTFVLEQQGGITFSGDFITYLEAFASAGELFSGNASASTTFEITITDLQGGQGIQYILAPDLLNETASVNPNGFGADIQTCGSFGALFGTCGVELGSSFSDTTGQLLGGNLYQLSLRSNANIDIARVSEPVLVNAPGTLALLAIGLIGLAPRRNKR
jgi:hypothetical protein